MEKARASYTFVKYIGRAFINNQQVGYGRSTGSVTGIFLRLRI
jgi:hypothetical protein